MEKPFRTGMRPILSAPSAARSDGAVTEKRDSPLLLRPTMAAFGLTLKELADLLFLTPEKLEAAELVADPDVSHRVHGMVAVLDRASKLGGVREDAVIWYRDITIPGFGNVTAAQLVADGRHAAVLDYLDAVADGAFA